jgi:hypothetical protein
MRWAVLFGGLNMLNEKIQRRRAKRRTFIWNLKPSW